MCTLDSLSDICVPSDEEEDDLLDTIQAIEEIDFDITPLPSMAWTSIKYKQSQVTQFIGLMQRKLVLGRLWYINLINSRRRIGEKCCQVIS